MIRSLNVFLLLFSALGFSVSAMGGGTYSTQSGGAGGANPHIGMDGFASIEEAAQWAIDWAYPGNGSWCYADPPSI